MGNYFIWVLLFLGNVALMVLWVHYIIRVLFGECPHCGTARKAPLLAFLQALKNPLRQLKGDNRPAHTP